jgi:adenosine deaminase
MKNLDPIYNNIPKTELHIHLEGAIHTQTVIDSARQFNIPLPTYKVSELDRHVKVYEQMKNLHAVLEAFSIFQNIITSPQIVKRIAWELFADASGQNIKLLEVRFSPDWAFHLHHLDWDACLEELLSAKEYAERKFDMAIGYIAICSRSMGVESCVKTFDWAIHNRQHFVGVDLADSEAKYPIKDFARSVLKAKDAGLKVTVHSGEDTPASYVMDTISAVAPHRIGHGIHIIEDMQVVQSVIENGITLEVSPWSNFLTNSVRTIKEHPLKKLFDLGVRVTINSDDPEVLDTNVNNEYRIAHEILGMSIEEIAVCNHYAFEASFIPEADKQRIWDKYFA